jgi:hypothetical protein
MVGGITIIIPPINYKFIGVIKNDMLDGDKLYDINIMPRSMAKRINQKVSESLNECIVVINPNTIIPPHGMLDKVREQFDGTTYISFDINSIWLSIAIPKSKFPYTTKSFDSVDQFYDYMVSCDRCVYHTLMPHTREQLLEYARIGHSWEYPINNMDVSKFHSYIDDTLLYSYKSDKPRVTVCMTNFLRYGMLIRALNNLINLETPLNIILWVNQCDSMSEEVKTEVEGLLKRFSGYRLIYNSHNIGNGYPLHEMFDIAKKEFDTEYVMTSDDDILYHNKESFILSMAMLDQQKFSEYGAIGVWITPNYNIVKIVDNKIVETKPTEGFHDVDCIGGSTTVIRREVLDTCNYDYRYVMGYADWDFSLLMGSKGWKIGMVCDLRYKPLNDPSNNDKDYISGRYNINTINDSIKLFVDKWGIEVEYQPEQEK